MAAKKKSTQTDEPVVVEEEVEETQTAAPPGPAPADHTDEEQKDTNVTDNQSAPETEPEPEIEIPAQEPKMEEQQTADTQESRPSDFFGTPELKSGGGFPKAILAALALLLVAGGVAGFMFLKSGGQFLGVSTETSPTPEAAPLPQPSPAAEEVDLSEFSVRVLNGTGTAGEAGKVKALLEEAGFEDVKTGNAPSENNTVTTISAKADVPAGAIKAIDNALKGSFKTEVGDALDADSLFDIVVTTGGASAKDATGSAKEE